MSTLCRRVTIQSGQKLKSEGRAFRKFLMPGERPEAFFPAAAEVVKARTYCNVHDLWPT